MVFSSSYFLVYFLPITLLIYFLLPARFKNAFLLLASIFFYSWGGPKFIFVILATTTVDFYFVRMMHQASTKRKKQLLLILSLSLNLGLLFYFKYCNFFIENINGILALMGTGQITWMKVLLPIGISFYTFESITYVVDVYRGIHKPLNNFFLYQLYILLFPKLIAGPIMRYHDIADQLKDRSPNDTFDNKLSGFLRFCIGLSKKVIIANVMGEMADHVFSIPSHDLTSGVAWLGMISYTFQIYFDFSGYSDMAIGIGSMLGFRISENFDNPYTSGSITEFWRRWHITLGKWMKHYLYIPLGGNKVDSKIKLYINLWIVFIASGFWHGAAWTFIFWGIYHGFFLVVERIFLLKFYSRIGKLPSVILTFFFVAVGWVFFRSDTISGAFAFVTKLFGTDWSLPALLIDQKYLIILVLAFMFSFFTLSKGGMAIQDYFYFRLHRAPAYLVLSLIACSLFIISLSFVTTADFNPFIYFRF